MIATVLLIAFTIAIGGIISIWLSGYTRTTTESVGGGTDKLIKCSASILQIKKVTNNTDENVSILVSYTSGSEKLTGVGCEAIGNGTVSNTSAALSPGQPAAGYSAGSSFYCSVNATLYTITTLDRVRVKGTCLADIPITVECTPNGACWTG